MRKYLEDTINTNQTGLYICQLPTGYGKSYAIANEIARLVNNSQNSRKIIYLTTMIKNLPSEEILHFLNNDKELYDNNILQIRSNFDEVEEKLIDLEIPEEFQSDAYTDLRKLLTAFKNAKNSKINDNAYLKDLKDRINNAERSFRREIRIHLKKRFPHKEARLEAIRNNSQYQWIGTLYPAVFTDSHRVLLMTVKKFLGKNSTLIEPSYDFLTSGMLGNAIIFIDEFDASKEVILNHIIDNALSIKNEYLSLFRQINQNLNPNVFSSSLMTSCKYSKEDNSAQINRLIERGNELSERYSLYLGYKTVDDAVNRQQNFLFHDNTFHTVLQGGKQYIRTALNNSTNRVEIHFESKENFYKNRNNSDLVIYSMLREIQSYLAEFRYFLYSWAESYRQMENSVRTDFMDEMPIESAISTILSRLSLTPNQKELLLAEKCSLRTNQHQLLSEQNFYTSGMEIFEFEDSDEHNENTNLQFIRIFDTPEKIIRFLSEKATVFAVSATADIPTVIGNYNLNYLGSTLSESYHPMNKVLHDRIQNEMQEIWLPYRNGKVTVHTEILKKTDKFIDIEQNCRSFMNNQELAGIAATQIMNYADKDYVAMRYCNILKVMHSFWVHDSMKSLLCLEMELPKENHPSMDINLLKKLLSITALDAEKDYSDDTLTVLSGNNFDKNKDKLLDELSRGEKRFVMSTYKTIGAGQNLQYSISDKSGLIELTSYLGNGDKRHFSKDFDALYLGNITHLIVNTHSENGIAKRDMLTMLFNVEELYHNGELNYKNKDEMIKLAFRSYANQNVYENNSLYNTKSLQLKATQIVIQAVGRLCRTFLKNPDIYLFIDEGVLEKLDVSEMKKRILSPEMEAIIQCCTRLGKVYTDEEKYILNTAERISTEGMWTIRRILSRNWDDSSIRLWENLRQLVLTYPTASSDEYEHNELLKKLYITSSVPQNRYFYSQYSDFNNVTIDFGDDKTAFRNSKRVKIQGEASDVGVWTMSEEESGLPAILKYPGMKNHFKENNFALGFSPNMYMMSPVLFHNIYKGALGETAGAFILEQERGIKLQSISTPDVFEFFDFIMKPDVYVDFKNWKFTYIQDRESVRKEILRKLDTIGGKRVYIINITNTKEFGYSESHDGRIIEIPGLIDNDGKIISSALDHIKKEDYE